MLAQLPSAHYWFQSGATAGGTSNYNDWRRCYYTDGIAATVSFGSFGFWVGETLSNGVFAQVGYIVSNQTGYMESNCSTSGCTSEEMLQAGSPRGSGSIFQPGRNPPHSTAA